MTIVGNIIKKKKRFRLSKHTKWEWENMNKRNDFFCFFFFLYSPNFHSIPFNSHHTHTQTIVFSLAKNSWSSWFSLVFVIIIIIVVVGIYLFKCLSLCIWNRIHNHSLQIECAKKKIYTYTQILNVWYIGSKKIWTKMIFISGNRNEKKNCNQ